MPTTETTEASFDQTLTQSTWVVIEFCGSWSGPCHQFAPVFDAVAEQHPDVVFTRVDIACEQGLEARFDITVVPTVIALREGHVIFRYAGAMSHAELEWAIAKLSTLYLGDPDNPPG